MTDCVLGPCPSCLGAGDHIRFDHRVSRWSDPGLAEYAVTCENCGRTGQVLYDAVPITMEDLDSP